MKIWHMQIDGMSRAFVSPNTKCQAIALWFRGWRRFESNCRLWTLPSRKTKAEWGR